MFKKLSAAFVAMSLAAVAQPASAQNFPRPVQSFKMTVASVTATSVKGGSGVVWTLNPGAVVVRWNERTTVTALRQYDQCTINGTLQSRTAGTIDVISCTPI